MIRNMGAAGSGSGYKQDPELRPGPGSSEQGHVEPLQENQTNLVYYFITVAVIIFISHSLKLN